MAVASPTRVWAWDCSKRRTLWPRMFQMMSRVVKYHSAK
jgi:hypothetical protein